MSVFTVPANASGNIQVGSSYTQIKFAGANSSNHQVWLENTDFVAGYGGSTPITVSTALDLAAGLTSGTQCNFERGPSEPNWNSAALVVYPCLIFE